LTVSQIRSYMAEKVIPESVMPQNISVCLMDEEDRVLPEMDAFTFLNRVRALGIGSADFLYLLKGCGAPEEAIEKIENNPAMNLQNLIVTLDSSGLTSQDYTRMLYTARQVWERTLTMRMEKKQLDKFRENQDPATVMLDKADLPTELIAQEQALQDDDPDTVFIPHGTKEDHADDFDEDQPTALLSAGSYNVEKPVYTARQLADDDAHDDYDADDEDEAQPDILTARQLSEDEQPDEEPLDEFIARQLSDVEEDEEEEDDEERPDILTARQLSADEHPDILTARQKPKKEYIGRSDYDAFYDEDKPVARHTGKIIASAVGAALLLGLNTTMVIFDVDKQTEAAPTAYYAADNAAVFAEIHSAYTSGALGGGSALAYTDQRSEVFGHLLIQQPEQLEQLGVYNVGSRAFAAEPDCITVYEAVNDTATEVFTIQPPEGAQFLEMIEGADSLTAVYADADSAGIISYNSDGQVLYTSEQCGTLTDVYIYMDAVSLGTVYTPPFTQSFTVEQTEFYLPQFTVGGAASVMLPTEVILSRSTGCSYAVYGCYSLADGSLRQRAAALGDPVFSGAEQFLAVMKDDAGYTLLCKGTEERPVITAQTASLLACDIGDTFVFELSEDAQPYDSTLKIKREQALTATAESTETGTTVYLRGLDLAPLSAITNINGTVTALRMHGGILYILGESGVLMAVDISDASKPVILELTAADGIINGDSALCSSISGTMVKLTLYRRDEQTQAVTEAGSTSKIVTLAEGTEATMCSANTFYIGDQRYGAAFSYFDGVSRISEYALFGRTKATHPLFDKGSFVCAADLDGALYLIYENGSIKIN